MNVLFPLAQASIYLVMVIAFIAAVCVVTLGNLFYAAMALVLVLAGTAIVFVVLHAEFLAIVQILIYVGGVMTLVIFAIMMTSGFGDKTIVTKNNLVIPGAVLVTALFTGLAKLIFRTPWNIKQASLDARISVSDIGTALMGEYVFPFEVISVVLVAALVGAIVIARKDKSA